MRVTIYDHELDRTTELELTASQYDELKAFLRGLKKPPELDYKQVLERYNALCRSLPPATRITDLADAELLRLEAKLTAKGIMFLNGKVDDPCIRR